MQFLLFFPYLNTNMEWKFLILIQPGINPTLGKESLVEFANNGLVRGGVAEEDTEFAGFGHEGFPERRRMVKLYGNIEPKRQDV